MSNQATCVARLQSASCLCNAPCFYAAGTHSFVPSLNAEEMEKLGVKRIPQNPGETVEMQV